MPATDTEAGRIEPTSLADLLRVRAASQPQDRAYVLLSDRGGEVAAISFADLDRRAAVLARRLAGSAAAGDRALLLFPMGIDCLVAFFGCLYAGIIAVPMMLPRRQSRRDASSAIVADCGPRLALTTTDVIGRRPRRSARPVSAARAGVDRGRYYLYDSNMLSQAAGQYHQLRPIVLIIGDVK